MIRAFCDICNAEFACNSPSLKTVYIPEYIYHNDIPMYAGEKRKEICEECYPYLMKELRKAFDTIRSNPEQYKIKYEF